LYKYSSRWRKLKKEYCKKKYRKASLLVTKVQCYDDNDEGSVMLNCREKQLNLKKKVGLDKTCGNTCIRNSRD
jgi:hypothetical protein